MAGSSGKVAYTGAWVRPTEVWLPIVAPACHWQQLLTAPDNAFVVDLPLDVTPNPAGTQPCRAFALVGVYCL